MARKYANPYKDIVFFPALVGVTRRAIHGKRKKANAAGFMVSTGPDRDR